MDRQKRDFLLGFRSAALLAQSILACPPSHTSPEDYLRDVAHLHADADDPIRRGLAVGCLSALGEGDGAGREQDTQAPAASIRSRRP